MKKLLKVVLAGILACSLAACTSSAESGAKSAVDSFFLSLEAGKIDEAFKHVDGDSFQEFSEIKESEDQLISTFDSYDLSDTAKTALSDVFSNIMKQCIKSHKITKVEKVSDTEYKVTVDTTILDPNDLADAISEDDMTTFMTNISDQATEKYNNEGEAAAAEYLVTELAKYLNTKYNDALATLQPETKTMIVTVDKEDDAWKITGTEEQ